MLAENRLVQQAVFLTYKYAIDHNDLVHRILKSIPVKGASLELLITKKFPEFGILLRSPFMVLSSKVSESLALEISKRIPSQVWKSKSEFPILPFLKSKSTISSTFSSEFLQEVLLLSRGPQAFVVTDLGLLTPGPAGKSRSYSATRDSFNLLKVLPTLVGFLPNFKGFKGIPSKLELTNKPRRPMKRKRAG